MRSIGLLPLLMMFATPAIAQGAPAVWTGGSNWADNPGAHIAQPVTGYGADFTSSSRTAYQNDALSLSQNMLAEGRYREADAILTDLMGKISSRQVRFLKGVSSLGVGKPEVARRYFRDLAKSDSTVGLNALTALAIAEVRLGNGDEARQILVRLEKKQVKCASECTQSESLDRAVTVVRKALI